MSLVRFGSLVGVLWWMMTAFGLEAGRDCEMVESLREELETLSELLLLEYE